MVIRTVIENQEHRRLIKMMVEHFTKEGYENLKSDLQGQTQPEQIGNHIPDLTCNKNNPQETFIILEAESCSTINNEQTKSQWVTFSQKAREVNGEFHVVVPRTCNDQSGRGLANQRLRELGITANAVWTPTKTK